MYNIIEMAHDYTGRNEFIKLIISVVYLSMFMFSNNNINTLFKSYTRPPFHTPISCLYFFFCVYLSHGSHSIHVY